MDELGPTATFRLPPPIADVRADNYLKSAWLRLRDAGQDHLRVATSIADEGEPSGSTGNMSPWRQS